ncbi:MAG: PEP-CTERM sorting domain-containing protein [Myxococcota bacterium]
MRLMLQQTALLWVIWLGFAGPVTATTVVSYNDDALIIPPLPFGSVSVRPDSLLDVGAAALALDGATVFSGLEDIDAAHRRADGQFIFSTVTTSFINGTPFLDGDLVLYDPVLDSASIFFGESNFTGAVNIDAFFLFESGPDAGKFLLSTSASATVGGLSFGHGDIVLYDPAAPAGTEASVFFPQSNFGGTVGQRNVDAVDILPNGNLLLSTSTGGGSLAGLTLREQDLVEWDGVSASQFLDGDGLFDGTTADLNAATQVLIPEPGTSLLLGLSLFGLVAIRRFSRRRLR